MTNHDIAAAAEFAAIDPDAVAESDIHGYTGRVIIESCELRAGQRAVRDYLAETNHTPITEAALREMGWCEPPTGATSWLLGSCALFLGFDEWNFHHQKVNASFITTLGELRTLLRLCGEKP